MQQRAMECKLINPREPGDPTRCMRTMTEDPSVHQLHYRQKHACSHLDHCSGHGECYLRQCFCGAPFAGERCERTPKQPACSLRCDDCFRHLTHGRARVSLERWQRASWAEATWWGASKQRGNDDHAGAMAGQFQEFKALPHRLGHVLEIGCGPFTQLKSILGVRSKEWSVESLTLAGAY